MWKLITNGKHIFVNFEKAVLEKSSYFKNFNFNIMSLRMIKYS